MKGPRRNLYFLNLFIVLTYFLYICMFITCCFRQRRCVTQGFFMRYSMRLELTLVSCINDSCLVRLVYIGVVVPLSWSVFTLVCFTHLWYLICLLLCVFVCLCVLALEWFWVSLTVFFCVCKCVSSGVLWFSKFTGSYFFFFWYM